ncbi:MAG TPA: mucoidy inhibitor MuiA family protein [Smithella sp.]|nr:mucoidy inhibitor MuiA family protein [Smithella sp.]
MKARDYYIHYKLMIVLILLLPVCSMAAVKEVTLYPNSAKISEITKIQPQCSGKCKAVITLPPQADPESLVVSLPPSSHVKIEDLQAKPIPVQDEARIAELRKQITALDGEKKETQAKMEALDAQLQFWLAQTKAKTKTVADSYKLADAIGRNVHKDQQEKFAAETQLEKIDKNLKKLQDELNQAAGRKETAWDVTLTLSGSGQNEIALPYTYTLFGCGWLPLYRVEALPADKSVAFSWEAEVWQSSGEDWKQVQLNLATLQPITNVNPPDMPDWIIRPRKFVRKMAAADMASAQFMAKEGAKQNSGEEEAPGAAPEPVESINTTYSIWSLGKINVAAGSHQRLKIKDETWPAEFLFMARPAINPQAFVRAQVKLEKPADIPSGQAIFVIDGAVLGKREFSFAGSEGTLFFGTSPLISVTSSTIADQSGEKTIFQDKQTRSWQWLIEAKNLSTADIKLRIEEPAPQARDKRIKLEFKQNPEPTEKDHSKFVWLLDVPAGQKKTIQNSIELEAPNDMNIDFGWR